MVWATPTSRRMSKIIRHLARSRSAAFNNRVTSSTDRCLLVGPSRFEFTEGHPYQVDQFPGNSPGCGGRGIAPSERLRSDLDHSTPPGAVRPAINDAGGEVGRIVNVAGRVLEAASGARGVWSETCQAEEVGFEPTVPLRVHRFSRPALSATQAPLRGSFPSRDRRSRKNSARISPH